MASSLPTPEKHISNYSFPKHRLKPAQKDATKIPVVLVLCGSFSPITSLHLQMFEMASDFIKSSTNFEVMGGYLSPVSDAYRKPGLAKSIHRIRMCELAVDDKRDSWLMVDPWEALQPDYTPTAQVLDHFNREINEVLGGAQRTNGIRVQIRIMLLAGADLVQTFSTPGVWSDEDLEHILSHYGAFVLKRQGTDIEQAMENFQEWKDNIYIFEPNSVNDVSSTKIRLAVEKGVSVKYLTPDPVVDYIEEHGLYHEIKGPSMGTREG